MGRRRGDEPGTEPIRRSSDCGYDRGRMARTTAPHTVSNSLSQAGAGSRRTPAQLLEELDLVSIRNLRAWTLIGVHPHERETRQEIRIDAQLGTDIRAAAASDQLEHAIDYSAVARAFREHAGGASRQLVEALAEDLCAIALERFGAIAVRLSIEKPGAVPGADAVGVSIVRARVEASS